MRIDRIGQCLKQLEWPEPALQQLQALPVGREHSQRRGPALGDLAEQLQARTVLQALTRDHHVEIVLAQQVDAVRLGGNAVDRELRTQGADDRVQHG